MCQQCHSKFTDEEILNQWKESLESMKNDENKTCSMFNVASISHILISAGGNNGEESKKLSIELLNQSIK